MPPTVSNLQIAKEGVSAMFTMYGTAGHEFAQLGVPVVNAADNPHIAYPLNYHPATIEEYADLIRRADRLTSSTNPDDVAVYVYMNYYYIYNHGKSSDRIRYLRHFSKIPITRLIRPSPTAMTGSSSRKIRCGK